MLEVICITAIVLTAYTYVGYAVVLKLLPSRLVRRDDSFQPPVTVCLSAYKGEAEIIGKIENTLAADYPADKLSMIVVADGSDDQTADLVVSFGDPRVRCIRQVPRQGKTAAQKKAVATAETDILIFTDLTTRLEPASVRTIVASLADPSVGLVSSKDVWVEPDGTPTTSGQGAYVRYEMWLRHRESIVNSIVSASGCFYAVRKEFFEPIPDHLIDDTVIPLTVVERGSRCIHDNTARSLVPMIPNPGREFPRRARMTLGGINALFYKKQLLNPFRFGLYAVQLWSHKLLRWLVPFFMIAAFAANLALAQQRPDSVWSYLMMAQFAFYAVAVIGWLVPQQALPTPIRLVYFFVSSNFALLYAWWQWLTNRQQTTWQESRGS